MLGSRYKFVSCSPEKSPEEVRSNRLGPIEEQLLRRNVKRFRGGLVFKAHRLVYHSTIGSRVTKKKKIEGANGTWGMYGIFMIVVLGNFIPHAPTPSTLRTKPHTLIPNP